MKIFYYIVIQFGDLLQKSDETGNAYFMNETYVDTNDNSKYVNTSESMDILK